MLTKIKNIPSTDLFRRRSELEPEDFSEEEFRFELELESENFSEDSSELAPQGNTKFS